jgi:hypothetical protein
MALLGISPDGEVEEVLPPLENLIVTEPPPEGIVRDDDDLI